MSTAGLTLSDGFDLSGLSLDDLWLRYVAVGGSHPPWQLARNLTDPDLGAHEHNMVALALNEHLNDLGGNYPVAYL